MNNYFYGVISGISICILCKIIFPYLIFSLEILEHGYMHRTIKWRK